MPAIPPAVIYDIGGGPGVHALWLARQGYTVHLLDAVPRHVEQARAASLAQPDTPLVGVLVGDARKLPFAEASADVVLLLGPLYHLIEREDRLAALREVLRVLRPGGILCAAAISRFTSLFDNLQQRPHIFTNKAEVAMVIEDLASGQHRNPTGQLTYFTTTCFHHPDDLRGEIDLSGLHHIATFSIEGPLWLMQDAIDRWTEAEYQATFLTLLRAIEQEPSLLGMSAHLLAVARKEE